MYSMPTLNADIVAQILDYIPIYTLDAAIDSIYPEVHIETKIDLLEKRCSLFKLFSAVTYDPAMLILSMVQCGVILSGSRAADYFNPGLTEKESGWDFVVGSVEGRKRFVGLLTRIGYVPSSDLSEDDIYGHTTISITVGTLPKDGVLSKVQIIMCPDYIEAPFKFVETYHSSIIQTIVSPYVAIDYHSRISSKYQSVIWYFSHDTDDKTLEAADACVRKYKDRGVVYSGYTECKPWTDPPFTPLQRPIAVPPRELNRRSEPNYDDYEAILLSQDIYRAYGIVKERGTFLLNEVSISDVVEKNSRFIQLSDYSENPARIRFERPTWPPRRSFTPLWFLDQSWLSNSFS